MPAHNSNLLFSQTGYVWLVPCEVHEYLKEHKMTPLLKLNPITLLILAPLTVFANVAPQNPTDLMVELQNTPLLVENLDAPSLSWAVHDSDRNEKQTAYRIVVSTDGNFLSENGTIRQGARLTWDSGKVGSSRASGVDYHGPKLDAGTSYYWAVQTWDKDDALSPFSKINRFDTAIKENWQAKPIWYQSQEWQDYTVEFDLNIRNETAGFYLRAGSTGGYKYQFRSTKAGSNANSIVKFLKTEAKVTELGKPTTLPESIKLVDGKFVHVKMVLSGNTISTYIDGVLADETKDEHFLKGAIGVWSDSRENGFQMKNLSVTSNGTDLYQNKFNGTLGMPFPTPAVSVDAKKGFLQVGLNKDNELYGAIDPADYVMETGKDWVFLRKAFRLQDKPIQKAMLYATGQTPESTRQYTYRINLNGKFIGLGPVRGYDNNNYYHVYDVTKLLTPNQDNAIGVAAFSYGSNKSFMSELKVTYVDGTTQLISTDDSWKVLDGSQVFPFKNDVHAAMAQFWCGFRYPSENIIAEKYPFGFDLPSFDDSKWKSPQIQKSIENLKGYPASNLQVTDIAPKKITKLKDGSFLLDYGITVIGGMKMDIDLKKPVELNIKTAEVLDDQGNVKWKTAALVDNNDTWQLKAGKQAIEHYGYRVFRYAQLTGLPDSVTEQNLTDYLSTFTIRYPFNENASSFSSSNTALNDVWNFSKKSIEILNNDIYVDSPNRERAPYEADTYIQQLSNYQLDKGYSLARYSVDWLTYHQTWPMEWKLFSILSSWQDYLHTGDDHLLRKNYEILKNKVPQKLMDGFDKKSGLVTADPGNGGPGENNDIVDWPKSLRDGYQFAKTHNVTNAFFYQSMTDLANIANALGKKEDEKLYRQYAALSQKGIQKNFFDQKAGVFKDNVDGTLHHSSQANAFVVEFGGATKDQAKAAAKFLAEKQMLKGNVYSSFAALGTMMAHGQSEEAINQITGLNSDGSSRGNSHNWLHMMEVGSGSTMEAWNESDDLTVSHSHAWGTTPTIVTAQDIFGIKPIKPAYEEFEIKPIMNGLEHAAITVPTIRGEIAVSFNSKDDSYKLEVDIPANTQAFVYVPAQSKEQVYEGDVIANKAQGVKYIGSADGYVKYLVGSGHYLFNAKSFQ